MKIVANGEFIQIRESDRLILSFTDETKLLLQVEDRARAEGARCVTLRWKPRFMTPLVEAIDEGDIKQLGQWIQSGNPQSGTSALAVILSEKSSVDLVLYTGREPIPIDFYDWMEYLKSSFGRLLDNSSGSSLHGAQCDSDTAVVMTFPAGCVPVSIPTGFKISFDTQSGEFSITGVTDYRPLTVPVRGGGSISRVKVSVGGDASTMVEVPIIPPMLPTGMVLDRTSGDLVREHLARCSSDSEVQCPRCGMWHHFPDPLFCYQTTGRTSGLKRSNVFSRESKMAGATVFDFVLRENNDFAVILDGVNVMQGCWPIIEITPLRFLFKDDSAGILDLNVGLDGVDAKQIVQLQNNLYKIDRGYLVLTNQRLT